MSPSRNAKAGKDSSANTLVPHLQEQVQSAVATLSGVVRRRVLASDGWFVNDKLFTLVTRQARIVVRLPDDSAREALLALDGAGYWRIKNRKPMKDWLQLPEAMHDDADAIAEWVARAWSVVRSDQSASSTRKPRKKAAAKRKKASR